MKWLAGVVAWLGSVFGTLFGYGAAREAKGRAEEKAKQAEVDHETNEAVTKIGRAPGPARSRIGEFYDRLRDI